MPPHGGQGLQEEIAADTEFLYDPAGRSARALVDEGQKNVLGRNIFIFQPLRLFLSLDEELAQALGEIDFAGLHAGAADSGLSFQFLLETVAHLLHRHFHALEQLGKQSIGLFEQSQQQMLAVNLHMAKADRFGLRRLYCFLGLNGKLVEIHTQGPSFFHMIALAGGQPVTLKQMRHLADNYLPTAKDSALPIREYGFPGNRSGP